MTAFPRQLLHGILALAVLIGGFESSLISTAQAAPKKADKNKKAAAKREKERKEIRKEKEHHKKDHKHHHKHKHHDIAHHKAHHRHHHHKKTASSGQSKQVQKISTAAPKKSRGKHVTSGKSSGKKATSASGKKGTEISLKKHKKHKKHHRHHHKKKASVRQLEKELDKIERQLKQTI